MSKLSDNNEFKNKTDNALAERERFERLLEEVSRRENFNETYQGYYDEEQVIDVLNLPPRREVHKDKSSKTKLSFSKGLFRLILIIIVLALIIGLAYYFLGDDFFTFK